MGVILPGVERDGISPQFFRGSGTGEVWEFTPVSPSSVYVFLSSLILCLYAFDLTLFF